MTPFSSQAYNMLLQPLLFSITPALPSGTVGARQPVGTPETIPDITFISRPLIAGDGIEPAEMANLNFFINQGIEYHTLFGLTPRLVNSFEEIIDHFNGSATPIGRFRLVSHGNDAFLFLPMFNNGIWDNGIGDDTLDAFQTNDEQGLRFIITDSKTDSPVLPLLDSTADIVVGLRAHNSAVLAPFGLSTSGSPSSGAMMDFFEVLNDHYQVQNGKVMVHITTPSPPPDTLISATQKGILTASLDTIENEIRTRLIGTMVGTTTLTATHLTALKTAIMGATPTELGFYGSEDLHAAVMTDLATAMAASPRVEGDLRNAISPGTAQPMFQNLTAKIFGGLSLFQSAALNMGGTTITMADIGANVNLQRYFLICNDIFFLQKGQVSIAGTPITAAQKADLRLGLIAISDLIAPDVVAGPGSITLGELSILRTTIENLTFRETLTTAHQFLNDNTYRDLDAANTAIAAGFRNKLNNVRSLMRSTSVFDIRGCLVGNSTNFLNKMRSFLGNAPNQPIVTAPEWFQSFPKGVASPSGSTTTIYPNIDHTVNTGIGSVTAADVTASFTVWRTAIEFDPHFTFISGLFAASPTALFDFATLEWRTWRVPPATTGIPILRMQAERIDDFMSLDLGTLIERFGIIFEIPTASRPSAMVRTRLTQLSPHIAAFKGIRTAVIAAGATPSQTELDAFFAQLSALAPLISAIAAPSSPLIDAVAPSPVTKTNIDTYVGNFQTHIDTILTADMNGFFTAVRTRLGEANAQIRYCLNIGVPILLKHSSGYLIWNQMSSTSNTEHETFIANALRSWMKIQWTGTPSQSAAMNTLIDGLAIGNLAQRQNASQAARLTDGDPTSPAPSAYNPLTDYDAHIIKRP